MTPLNEVLVPVVSSREGLVLESHSWKGGVGEGAVKGSGSFLDTLTENRRYGQQLKRIGDVF